MAQDDHVDQGIVADISGQTDPWETRAIGASSLGGEAGLSPHANGMVSSTALWQNYLAQQGGFEADIKDGEGDDNKEEIERFEPGFPLTPDEEKEFVDDDVGEGLEPGGAEDLPRAGMEPGSLRTTPCLIWTEPTRAPGPPELPPGSAWSVDKYWVLYYKPKCVSFTFVPVSSALDRGPIHYGQKEHAPHSIFYNVPLAGDECWFYQKKETWEQESKWTYQLTRYVKSGEKGAQVQIREIVLIVVYRTFEWEQWGEVVIGFPRQAPPGPFQCGAAVPGFLLEPLPESSPPGQLQKWIDDRFRAFAKRRPKSYERAKGREGERTSKPREVPGRTRSESASTSYRSG